MMNDWIIDRSENVLPFGDCIEGKIVVIKPERFAEKYRNAKYQLVVASGGFGCYADKLGSAVFVTECQCENPESYRRERHHVLGVASDQLIKKWKSVYGEISPEAAKYIGKKPSYL